MGKYVNNVSVTGLAKIFQSRDQRLLAVTVKGEEVHYYKGIKTRSKGRKAPPRYNMVPLFVKITKLLIREYGTILEDESCRLHGDDLEDFADLDDDHADLSAAVRPWVVQSSFTQWNLEQWGLSLRGL
eukprot:m.759617 g.759617  ORF g.759617 m.759617 type:complete len:128 (-) comp23198_c0_seq2:233-616(-)